VTPGNLSSDFVKAIRSPNSSVFIGGDRHANPCSADQDAALAIATGHISADQRGEVRVVNARFTVRSSVDNFVAEFVEGGLDLRFDVNATVITTD
jgi:hypothetical protein